MNTNNALVYKYMRLSPVFIYENDTIFNAIQAMKNFNLQEISIIKEDFSIVGCIDEKQLREIIVTKFDNDIELTKSEKIKDVILKHHFPVILYPKMKITSAYSAMKCLNSRYLPVAEAPWEKKIIGFLWLDDIESIVEEEYLKIPV